MSIALKISANTYRPQKKFMADIIYGMLASGSCPLKEVARVLYENSNTIIQLKVDKGKKSLT